MNHDLKSLSAKLKASKTCFNVKKTELIHFCSRTEKLYYTLKFKLNWKRLRPNHAVKYLGVLKEKHLQWIKRKTQIQIKLNCALGIGNKMRNYTNRDVLKMIYHFLFGSHLEYIAYLWEEANTQIKSKLSYSKIKQWKKNLFQKAIWFHWSLRYRIKHFKGMVQLQN